MANVTSYSAFLFFLVCLVKLFKAIEKNKALTLFDIRMNLISTYIAY
jgi:hypothetical protein